MYMYIIDDSSSPTQNPCKCHQASESILSLDPSPDSSKAAAASGSYGARQLVSVEA